MLEYAEDRSRALGVRIRETLVERIARGHYAGGERLVELKLAEEFGTSQLPVREALRDLEMAGLVTSRPRRGSFVKPHLAKALHEIYRVRGALEEAAAREATPKLAGDVSVLQAHIDGMSKAAQSNDRDGMVFHSMAFHRAIVAAAGNELLLKLWDSLHLEIHTRVTVSEAGIDLAAAAESHQPIVDAIARGDTEAACRLSREHQAYFEHRCDGKPDSSVDGQ
jgi:DNA-binding GntR family transcriptional regulator